VRAGIQTIVFSKSRLSVECIGYIFKASQAGPSWQRAFGARLPGRIPAEPAAGNRARPAQRQRAAVVSTNALELGIDIGSLEACVINGYPGTIASTWQQAGRAGRRQGVSAIFIVASSTPLDQYIIMHPDYFFKQSPENAHQSGKHLCAHQPHQMRGVRAAVFRRRGLRLHRHRGHACLS
jgi:DEAD/DEAH box helicase domain-containing protein